MTDQIRNSKLRKEVNTRKIYHVLGRMGLYIINLLLSPLVGAISGYTLIGLYPAGFIMIPIGLASVGGYIWLQVRIGKKINHQFPRVYSLILNVLTSLLGVVFGLYLTLSRVSPPGGCTLYGVYSSKGIIGEERKKDEKRK